jgi:hypothetical protein
LTMSTAENEWTSDSDPEVHLLKSTATHRDKTSKVCERWLSNQITARDALGLLDKIDKQKAATDTR